ncbi:hypothetical protein KR038_002464 [Drosophila bunnanda]|nr:hypothetical protein KR038_002464 [Drosophila bunnanda]
MPSARRWCLLLGILLLAGSYESVDAEEGDDCKLVMDLPGICRGSSACDTIEGYLRSGTLSASQVPSCGLGLIEENICCPIAPCCPTDQVQLPAPSPSPPPPTFPFPSTSKEREREPVSQPPREREPRLDENLDFFDFNKLLSTTTVKPQKTHESMKMPTQSVGPWGIAPPRPPTTTVRSWIVAPWGWENSQNEPRVVVNRPMTTPRSNRQQQNSRDRGNQNLIHLVNDRLRHQGMQIEPAREVQMPTRQTTPAPSPVPATVRNPFEPFQFRGQDRPQEPQPWREPSNDLDDEVDFGPNPSSSNFTLPELRTTTTTASPVNPVSPTSRVNVPDNGERPAVAACTKLRSKVRIKSITPHILGGVPVELGVYPHMAAIAYTTFGTVDFRCGGSLIASRYVLTAAHCVNSDKNTPTFVRLGTVNIEEPTADYQDINVVNLHIHPDYVSSSKYNDIAILELAEDAHETEYIWPACLYTDTADPPLDSKLFVAGWGVLNVTNRARSKILLRASLNLVQVDKCNASFAEQLSTIRALKRGIIDSLLCAADSKQLKDACQGDSGGPLIQEVNIEDGIYSVMGVISSGLGCATKTPGLYTRVSSFLSYIEGIVWPDNRV